MGLRGDVMKELESLRSRVDIIVVGRSPSSKSGRLALVVVVASKRRCRRMSVSPNHVEGNEIMIRELSRTSLS